jgi:hypothetical protein
MTVVFRHLSFAKDAEVGLCVCILEKRLSIPGKGTHSTETFWSAPSLLCKEERDTAAGA